MYQGLQANDPWASSSEKGIRIFSLKKLKSHALTHMLFFAKASDEVSSIATTIPKTVKTPPMTAHLEVGVGR